MKILNSPFFYRCIISSFLAFSGLIYEFLLAYFLSLTLGNTFLRFAATVGLFTLTLGVSALSFDGFPQKFKTNFYFLTLQSLVIVVAFLSPLWIHWMDPLLHPHIPRPVTVCLSHVPVILIGLLTGLELPFLFNSAEHRQHNLILAFDYIGMFLGSLLFPLVLFPLLGIFSSLYLIIAINGLVALVCWQKRVLQ
jgi:spermidine synthase